MKVEEAKKRLTVALLAGQPDKEIASRAKSFLRAYNKSGDQSDTWTEEGKQNLLHKEKK